MEITKHRIIKDLINEIKCLSPVEIELVGNNIVSMIEDSRLIHHGINKDYMPSGYTVDSFSDDSTIITEYSAEKNYFKDTSLKNSEIPVYEKIDNDINHAFKHTDPRLLKKIYLITTQEEPPKFRSKFNKTAIAQQHKEKIVIFDSREIAKLIYNQSIGFDSASEYYKIFFPLFCQNMDNFEYYGKIPSFCNKHIKDHVALDKINKKLDENNICVLSGMSGSGKTQLAIDYIHEYISDFENYIWLSGDDIDPNTSLASIQRTRGGAPLNLIGLFNTYKTILVIDDIEKIIQTTDFRELEKGFSHGGKVLITSQLSHTNSNYYLSVPQLSNSVLYEILGEEEKIDNDLVKNVVTLCKSSPLILSTIRNIVYEENVDRESLYKEILNNPTEISGNDGKSIMRRILSKLEEPVFESLKKIANTGLTLFDIELIQELIGILKVNNLRKLSILLPVNIPGFVKIHDLIASSIQDNLNKNDISISFGKYISKTNASLSPNIIRQIHKCSDILKDIYESKNPPELDWITYSLLQVEDEYRSQIVEDIYSFSIKTDASLESIRCLIDAKEGHAYNISSKDERRDYFLDCINDYENLLTESISTDIKVELFHHLGKTYRRTGNYDKALEYFEKTLKIDPLMHATYLQISHLGTQFKDISDIRKAGESKLSLLMDYVLDDFSSVPLRVSLGAITKLRSYKNIAKTISIAPEKVSLISEVIMKSAFEGFGQFFESFVAFTSLFSYLHSPICLKLIESIPELLTYTCDSVDKYNWLNACEAFTNLSQAASRDNKLKLSYKISKASISFADKYFESGTLSPYQGRVLAKAYITANEFEKALEAVDKVPEDKRDHWLIYRKSEAELKSNLPEAYKTAHKAYSMAKQDKFALDRISIYHDLISQCAEKKGNIEESILEIKLAIEHCSNDRYKAQLENNLKELLDIEAK